MIVIHQNGHGDTILCAEVDIRGRIDLVPAENWRELEPEARAYLESRGVKASEAGTFECPKRIAARAQFGFELFWAQSGLPIGEALAEYRKRVLGEVDYARFAITHNLSPRTVELLEKYGRIPRRADTRARIERAYRLPAGFFESVHGGDL